MNAIEVHKVCKSFKIAHNRENSLKRTLLSLGRRRDYEKFDALKDVSFNVKKGEFLGIIGRNGSGKSTLLKILAGVYRADSGTVKVNGLISPFLELGVGFNGELSGRENVYLYGSVLGMSKKEIDSKYNEIVSFAELEKFMDTKLKNYSSGMQVRLAFSVGIQAAAEILLVDEVLAVGDANFQQKCFDVFERYKKEGKTVVLVTHDMSAVEKWCDRCVLIEGGVVKYDESGEKVTNYYKRIMEKTKTEPVEEKSTTKKEKKLNIKKSEYIKSIILTDKHNKKIQDFSKEKEILINIIVDCKNIENPNIGVSVFDEKDMYVFGTDTLRNKLIKKNKETFKASININIEKLLSGTYSLVVGLTEKDQWNNPIEISFKQHIFIINRKNTKTEGRINLAYNMEIKNE